MKNQEASSFIVFFDEVEGVMASHTDAAFSIVQTQLEKYDHILLCWRANTCCCSSSSVADVKGGVE